MNLNAVAFSTASNSQSNIASSFEQEMQAMARRYGVAIVDGDDASTPPMREVLAGQHAPVLR